MKESLLWQVNKKESSIQHYIFGTMHVKNEVAYNKVNFIKPYIDKCSSYVGEMNLNDPDLDNLHDFFLLEDATLLDLIPLKKYEKIRLAILKGFSIDLDQLISYKPIVISNMIAEAVLTQEYDVALDHHLWAYALEHNKNCYGLESAKNQYTTLVNIPIDFQLKSLLDCAKDTQKFRKKVYQLSKYYEQQRLKDLYKASQKSMGELRHLMIYDRNINMFNGLIKHFEKSPTFCAVGAAHLSGNKGLIALLKKNQYTVKPIY